MKKILCGLFFVLIISQAIIAIAGDYALPKNFALVLPENGKVKAEWAAQPLLEKKVKKAGFTNMNFRPGPDDVFWLGHRQKFLTDLKNGKSVLLPVKVTDYIFLRDKALFIMTDNELGVLGNVSEYTDFFDSVPYIPFQPLCDLPLQDCRMEASDSGSLFIYGYDAKTKVYAIYELSDDFSEWKKIFQSKSAITSMCISDESVYTSCGRLVFEIPRSGGEGSIVFSHPMENVRSLAVLGRNIFYATSSGVGIVRKEGSFEFMSADNCRLIAKDDLLYAVLPESMGILRFSNTNEFFNN